MWLDSETDRDFLNFEGVADTIAEVIVSASGRPVSIGVSGAWGVGKSSMIKLTKAALEQHQPEEGHGKYLFVEFNAWLYQGYDDARAALLDVIATKLEAEANLRQTGMDKARDFLGRVKWFRLAKLLAVPAASLALGIPPVGLPGEIASLFKEGMAGQLDGEDVEKAGTLAAKISAGGQSLLDPQHDSSPPKEIQALRDSFEKALEGIGVTLVVLIDDLDRCMPGTTISTLEAIRLFLFLKNTAFVIAADDTMIKHAVRRHFEGLDDDELVTNYFDKLVQIPIRVPAPGTQEVRAYLMMLFIDNSELSDEDKDVLRTAIAGQLRETWKGKRVDRSFVTSRGIELPTSLVGRLDTAERLAPLMASSNRIAGNPRLIKRFLNALSIRMSISKAQGVGVDEAVLTKLLLFERLATPAAYAALSKAVNTDTDGKPRMLAPWEEAASKNEEFLLETPWDDDFVREWIALPPMLADQDLRGALYVGREQAPLITAADRLSSEAAGYLSALLESPTEADVLIDSLTHIQRAELTIIMDRLLVEAGRAQEWGAPPILDACITVVTADGNQGNRLAGFLMNRPGQQIQPGIVPKIGSQPWAKEVFEHWLGSAEVENTVKKAIRGYVAK
ncbi:putative KAP-like P-loop ATPase [Pseudarthrobacter oxydans]|jgi:predicted KAP-like P-loop ATPase|uniref:KAP-like P-loop ATPase n=1 Tax=Pseudarthrobacter oxydans TaxID=1671 RepID=A0AAW8NJE8_PSEOX|nr:P-loop NTPase fold protein [Pseudarthrobacter oxydans]MDR6794818.1 putative KAP-like P-loop ATPase [Pseudarthrobacter oxydans]MDR7166232.1 putative KAP-like P-loop ATPase [Pseudarthrobacter oxydans]BFE43583.1 KAP family P-loop domain protein [Pseudarthrobacter oxydans]